MCKKIKKFLSAILISAIVATMFPITASAEIRLDNIAQMTKARGFYPSAAPIGDNAILVFGGRNNNNDNASEDPGGSGKTAAIYNTTTNSWSNAADMPTKRWNAATSAAVLHDGRVLIAGGKQAETNEGYLTSIDVYTPSSDTWETVANFSTAVCYSTVTTLLDGRVLIAGGETKPSGVTDRIKDCWIFDPDDNSLTKVASMKNEHSAHAATLLKDGRVLVVGGSSDTITRTKNVEVYDPKTDIWTARQMIPTLNGKVGMVLVTLDSGIVMMMGGNSGTDGSGGADTDSWYYYPERNVWEAGPTMTGFSKSRAAYAMMGNTVYVFGGGNDSDSYTRTAFKITIDEPTLAEIEGLSVSPGQLSPMYDRDQISYTALTSAGQESFPYSQGSIVITPAATEDTTLAINGSSATSGAPRTVTLQVGRNETYIDVKDADQIVRRYTIVTLREGNPTSMKTVAHNTATDLLGVGGLTITGLTPIDSALGTVQIVASQTDSRFQDIRYTPAYGYAGTFDVYYATHTGDKSIEVAVSGASPADDLVAYWSFDEGFTAHNGNANYTLEQKGANGGPVRDQFMGRKSVKFDRDNSQYLLTSDPAITILPSGESFSYMAWYYLTAESIGTNDRYFVLETNSEDYPLSYGLRINSNELKGQVYAEPNQFFYINRAEAGHGASTGRWHNIIVTYNADDPSQTRTAYINGEYGGSISAESKKDLTGLVVGAQRTSEHATSERFWEGYIDEVAIWNRALTEDEIQTLQTSQIFGAATYTVSYDGNGNTGGEAPVDSSIYEEGATVTVPGQDGLLRTGYNFAGWSMNADGSGTVYQPDNTFIREDNDTVLYAKWMEKTAVSIDEVTQIYSYDGSAKAFAISGEPDEGFTTAYNQDAGNVTPFNAGTYDVVITRDEDEIYAAYSKTITGGLVIEPAVISTKAIAGVMPPVRGEVPVTTIPGTDEYTCSIVWSPDHSPFSAGTVYTATITLTPKLNYTLAGVPKNFFTVEGATAANNLSSGEITAIFPATEAPTLSSMAVTTPPGKVTYKYGELFDPAGMVVKAVYDDDTEDTDFKDYTVDKTEALTMSDTTVTLTANGTELTATQPIVVNRANGPEAPSVTFSFDGENANKLMGAMDLMEYSLNGGADYADCSADMDLAARLADITAEKDILVRTKVTDTHEVGEIQTIDITRAATPSTAAGVDCTTLANNDGKITGITATMEYTLSTGSDWVAGTGSDITGLAPGTYLVRIKATGTVLASDAQSVTITAYTAPPRTAGRNPAPAPAYNADVKGGDGSTAILPVTVNETSGTASIDTGSLKIISDGAVVTIPSVPDVHAYSVGIPVPDISTTDMQGRLTVETEKGYITVPSNMLTGVTEVGGNRAQITISEGDRPALTDEVKNFLGDRPLLRLTLSIDGKRTFWNNPGAPVTVSIPYTPTAEELENSVNIVVWYIDGRGDTISIPNGRYHPETGMVTFSTTHFSDYAVVYNPVSFGDVAADAWYNKAVSFISARSITGGTGGGKYSPKAKLTRGEFIVLLMRAYGVAPDENPVDNFADGGHTYYTGYLAAAKQMGISGGVGNNLYAPDREISRQEMFTLLYNALKVIKRLPQGDSGKILADFTDAADIAAWSQEAMTLLVRTGAIEGNAGKLTPLGTSTRAEMAQLLYNLLGK